MKMSLHQALLAAAVVAFGLATIGVSARVNLVALGLFCSALAVFV
jgi:hypothetical protein